MLENGWVNELGFSLTADYQKIDFGSRMKHMKLRASNTVTFSWNGVDDDGQVLAADNLQNFEDINKGEIYVKGTGTIDITAWDGN